MRKEKVLRIIGKVLVIGFVYQMIVDAIEAERENIRLLKSIEQIELRLIRLQDIAA
jgi:hypothetical protein